MFLSKLSFAIPLIEGKKIYGELVRPLDSQGLVLFAHGSGSSRKSPRNQQIAQELQKNYYATLLVDLLTEEEAEVREKVFDCELLANRLLEVSYWIERTPEVSDLSVGLFGASTGAGAALIASAQWPHRFQVVISRGGRPDLAKEHLGLVRQPTLLIVGSRDEVVLRLNRQALDKLKCKKALEVVSGATHLFEEPGKLEEVGKLTVQWLNDYLKAPRLPFLNRKTGAQQLAKRLKDRKFSMPLVVAIPRGGIITGVALAQEIAAEVAVVFSRKMRHPHQPELAIGALCENDEPIVTSGGLEIQKESPNDFKREISHERRVIEKRKNLFKNFGLPQNIENRTVILTDDGIATGSTVLAAAKHIRKLKPKELIIAVPVAPRDSLASLKEVADEIICLAMPSPFFAVAEFYVEFPQVEDEECLSLLRGAIGLSEKSEGKK